MILLLTAWSPGLAAAQVVVGELVERETGVPIAGAFVYLLDEDRKWLGGTMTQADGRFRFDARHPGQYWLRAERIGYETADSDPIHLEPGATVRYRFAVEVRPFALDEIRVERDRRCVVRPEEGRTVARVWDEAKKALRATTVTEQEDRFIYVARYHTEELDPRRLTVREHRDWEEILVAAVPFISLEPEVMAEQGFVHADEDGFIYYGPDSHLLLSDAFLEAHCLRLASRPAEQGDWIGIEFEPIPGRDLPGIAGAVWLDGTTAELRHVEYRYAGALPFRVGRRHAGGYIAFERLPEGAWIVRDWWIRIPVVTQAGRTTLLHHYLVRGAEIVEVRHRDGRIVR